MPTFEFTSPDGKKYRVTAPEGASKEQAYGQLQRHLGIQNGVPRSTVPVQNSEEPFATLRDTAKGIAQGWGRFYSGLTMPGDRADERRGLPESVRSARAGTRETIKQFPEQEPASTTQRVARIAGEQSPTMVPGPGAGAKLGSRLVDVAERAAVGAGMGAIEDPEHPGRGAMAGAVGGVAPMAAGPVSKAAGAVGGTTAQAAATVGAATAAHALGLPTEWSAALWPAFWWGPLGRGIHAIGGVPLSALARQLRHVTPVAGGALAGKTEQALEHDPDRTRTNP